MQQSLALVFPGQGAQKVGMAASFTDHPLYREHLAHADEILGLPLSGYILDGPQEDLTRTEIAQPALLTIATGIYQVFQAETKISPTAVAGHSLGEYSALVVAGALDFETALKLVQLRGQLMQTACDQHIGGMCAILNPELDAIRTALKNTAERVVIANYNSPRQIVLSGQSEVLNALCQEIKRQKWGRPVSLKVSGAFHSPLMAPAHQKLAEAIAQVTFQETKIPIIMNASAQAVHEAHAIQELLQQQLTNPVRWQDSLYTLNQHCGGSFLELGSKTLKKLIEQTLPDAEVGSLTDYAELKKHKQGHPSSWV